MATSNSVDETDYQVTTKTFRKHNKEEIEYWKLKDIKLDVGHIIAKKNGGADDSDNYRLVKRGFNRRIKNNWDPLMFSLAGVERTRAAIRCSPASGYKEHQAQALVDEGDAMWSRYRFRYGRDYSDGGKYS